jgi:hypothetical protein
MDPKSLFSMQENEKKRLTIGARHVIWARCVVVDDSVVGCDRRSPQSTIIINIIDL